MYVFLDQKELFSRTVVSKETLNVSKETSNEHLMLVKKLL